MSVQRLPLEALRPTVGSNEEGRWPKWRLGAPANAPGFLVPTAMLRPDGFRLTPQPLLAHLMQVRLPGTIEDAVLVLLVDTDLTQHHEAVPVLRVPGLTSAEALLAELVSSGLSVRDAATASGISGRAARDSGG